ncbi:MAG TPA: hypothetical protein VF281_03720 [Candidatus Saccharimonadales bacterium]
MNIKQTLTTLAVIMSVFVGALSYAQPVYAAGACPEGVTATAEKPCCGGAQTSIIACTQGGGSSDDVKSSGVWQLLKMTLNILTAVVGVAAVGGIAYGAALYASAADSPDRAKKGMEFIKNVVIGLVAYGLMYVILNFLVPGGVIG